MGNRVQIAIKQSDEQCIYLYSHWAGEEAFKKLAGSLARGRDRWGDKEYLARIIFCDLVRGQEDDTTGFGIGVSQHSDLDNDLPTLDCGAKMITWLEGPVVESFEKFIERVGAA